MSKPGETKAPPTAGAPPGATAASPAVTKPNEPAAGEPVVIYSPEQNAAPLPVQFDKKSYDKYLAAANRDIAALHGRANMAGNLMSLFNIKDARLPRIYKVHYNNETFDPSKLAECPCCNKFDSGKKVWMSIDNIGLAPLGAAVPGFFDFAKFCITCLLTIGMLYSIYMMIIYGRGSECKYGLIERGCGDPWKFFLSAANYRRGGIDIIERTLMLISFLALYILKIVYFAWFRKLNAQSNAFVMDITDYSVELRGLPKNVTSQDIENFFHARCFDVKTKKSTKKIVPLVRMINFVYCDTDDILKKHQELSEMILEYKRKEREILRIEYPGLPLVIETTGKKSGKRDHQKQPAQMGPKKPLSEEELVKVQKLTEKAKDLADKIAKYIKETSDLLKTMYRVPKIAPKAPPTNANVEPGKSPGISSTKAPLADQKKEKDGEASKSVVVPNTEKFSGSAYVMFDQVQHAEAVRENMMATGLGKFFYKLLGSLKGPFSKLPGANSFKFPTKNSQHVVYIEKAEKPDEIIFQHLGVSVINRTIRKAISFLFSVIVIGGTFALILYLKSQEFASDNSQTGKLIVVGIGILIKVIGFLLTNITSFLIQFEKPETTTERNIGTIWRSTISVFCNSVLVLIVVNVVFKRDNLRRSMLSNSGVYNDLLFQLILSVIEAAASFAEPSIPLGWLKAWWDRRQADKSTIPQYEVNSYYEGAPFNFPRRFGKYLTLMMITFFLIRVFPYAPFIAAIIAVIFYWSDKYFLLRLAKIPEYNTNELPLSMLRFMDMIFVTWTVGYILFDLIAYDTIYTWSWVMFSLSVASLVFNANYALRKTFVFDAEDQSSKKMDLMTFKKTRPEFYSRSNPVYQLVKAIRRWKEENKHFNMPNPATKKERKSGAAPNPETKKDTGNMAIEGQANQPGQGADRSDYRREDSQNRERQSEHRSESYAEDQQRRSDHDSQINENSQYDEPDDEQDSNGDYDEQDSNGDYDSRDDSDESQQDYDRPDTVSHLAEEEVFGSNFNRIEEVEHFRIPPEEINIRLKDLDNIIDLSIPVEKKLEVEAQPLGIEP